MTPSPTVVSTTAVPATEEPLVTLPLAPLRRGLALVAGALRRRWLVVLATSVLFTGAAAGAASLLPRNYSSRLELLTRKTYLMPALADPRRAVPFGAEAPASAARSLVLQRATLDRIVAEAGLVERWTEDRPPLLRWKDALLARVRGPLPPEEMRDAVRELLAARLRVQVAEETVVIGASWWSPATAKAIVESAHAGFAAEREKADVQSIEATLAVLERQVERQRVAVEQSLIDLRTARARASAAARSTVAERQRQIAQAQRRDGEEEESAYLARIRRERRDERRAVLEVQLAEMSGTLGERHPDRIALEQAIAQLGAEAAREVAPPSARIRDRGSLEGAALLADASLSSDDPDSDVDVAYARSMMRVAVDMYQDLVTRAANARIEATTARAAAPFRYLLTHPAEPARKPDSPNIVLLIAAGLLTGIGAGALLAIATEVKTRAGRWDDAPSFVAAVLRGDTPASARVAA